MPVAGSNMYFIAILCPGDLSEKILKYKEWMRDHFGCTAALKSPAHITLVPPFWLESNWEDYLLSAVRSFDSGSEPIQIKVNGFSNFGRRVIFADVYPEPSLCKLREKLIGQFHHWFGNMIRKNDLPFDPHITIANRDLKPADYNTAWQHFKQESIVADFIAPGISLLKLTDGKWTVIGERLLPV